MSTKAEKKIIRDTETTRIIWRVVFSFLLAGIVLMGLVIRLSPKEKTVTGMIISNGTGVLVTYALLFFCMWIMMDKLFCSIDAAIKTEKRTDTFNSNTLHNRQYVFKTAAIIFLSWLPYLIICYPTITRGYDFFWQLLQGMGVFPLSNHHPIFGSLVFGAIFRLGYALGGASFGLALISIVQMILMALSMGVAFAVLQTIATIPRKVYYALVVFVCLCPVFPGHAVWAIKDAIFTAITIFLISQYLLNIWCISNNVHVPATASLPSLVFTMVLFSLYRNGVALIAAVLILVLIFFNIRICKNMNRAVKSAVALLVYCVFMLSWNSLMSIMDVYPTNIREAVSLPMRQVIKMLQIHPEELNTESEKILNSLYYEQISKGRDIKSIISSYDDNNADFIKVDFITDNNVIRALIYYWIHMGAKHPGSYADALLRGTDGYWYFGKNPHREKNGEIIHAINTTGPEDDFANDTMIDKRLDALFLPTVKSLEFAGADTSKTFGSICKETPWLDDLMHVSSTFPSARVTFGIILARMENIPLVSLILAPGTYFFILLLCFAYMFERRKIGRLLWPIILIEVLAWLSPVNGYTRYVLPVAFVSILLIGACFTNDPIKRSDENQ